MNVVGGKVLLPTYKYLARDEQNPHNPVFVNTGYDGNFISEVYRMKQTPQARYKRAKVKTKRVDFYPHDEKIYIFAQSINFSSFVKSKLKETMEEGKNGK